MDLLTIGRTVTPGLMIKRRASPPAPQEKLTVDQSFRRI
jgi:hypothetical protein